MSNKIDLQTLNINYAALIDTLRGKAAGSGGSGGTVETCTVDIRCNSGNGTLYSIDYVTVNNSGNVIYEYITPNRSGMLTLTCVCGSHITISNSSVAMASITDVGSILCARANLTIAKVTDVAGSIMSINCNTSSGGSAD